MELWATEYHQDMALGFRVTETLYHAQSPYQTVDVVETQAYGRLLLLDGAVMTTDKDEFVYHEMISHVPMLLHPNPKRVLVIGGGDGGTVRELVRHPEVESVILCEIDGLVVDACRQYFPKIASALDHPKVTVKIGDGVAYMANEAKDFDLIIVDSTDPIGPGEGLFTHEFYTNVFNALNPDGIMVAQTESPFLHPHIIQKVYGMYQQIFPVVRMYTGHVPTYPSGFWTWAFCSKSIVPEQVDISQSSRAKAIEKDSRYYNTAVHQASFALPNFVQELLKTPALAK
jgi:spermidine synthase